MENLIVVKEPRKIIFVSRHGWWLKVVLPVYEHDIPILVAVSEFTGTFMFKGKKTELRTMDNSEKLDTVDIAEAITRYGLFGKVERVD